ncbi:TRAP transporter small permease [Effusibacillus dendaii]|uniref:C4-dicarboxylate ABC transporter permease n=1 Tax=Effusibacillus dendaii TaxID=2743772 RepID=A0A7I8DGJ1_9BACL|nr:TRAP transporter small permease [Effusibacillus dendaii]BCJ86921.1 C4-dicarboxylate ABC transporter permease [Effusibacillus dendaii]
MKLLRYWLEVIIGSCLAVVVIATFLQVLFRFVLKVPAPWTEEITRFAFAYMVFFGTALGVKHHRHLSVDIIDHLSKKIRSVVVTIGYLISILFVAVFTYYSWVHTTNSTMQTTPTLEVSLMYMYIVMPISGVLMLFYLIKGMLDELKGKQEGGTQV